MISKPWFSRKQLNIIIVVTTLAIAILSTTGPDPLPEIQRFPGQLPAYYIDNDDDVSRLRLSFLLPEHGHSSQFMPQLMYQLLVQRLQQQSLSSQAGWPPISMSLQHDRLVLQINAREFDSTHLQQLLDWLSGEFNSEQWYQTAQRLQADRYIQQQSSPSPLGLISPLIGFDTAIDSKSIDTSYHHQLINRDNLYVSYLGDDPEDWLSRITAAQLPNDRSSRSSTLNWPHPSQQRHSLKQYRSVLARQTPGLEQGPLTESAVNLILTQPINGFNGDWQATFDSGLLLLTSQQHTADGLLSQLKQQLQHLEDSDIHAYIDAHIADLENAPGSPEQLLNQVETVAIYQLPNTWLQDQVEQLETQTPFQVREKALALLEASDYYWLTE